MVKQANVRNYLLCGMSAEDFARLAPHLVPCTGEKGDVLFRKEEPVHDVWFFESGICSLIAISAEGQRVESGIVGREGFAPVAVVMGSDRAPYEGIIQLPDHCWKIRLDILLNAINQSTTLLPFLLLYIQSLSTQIAYTALSNAVHSVEERLARWLLMCNDRIDAQDMPLTHEFLSVMLAVRRPSVTTSLHVLESNGFIRSERGCITIRNRAAMEEFAGDAYGPPEREYERLLGNH